MCFAILSENKSQDFMKIKQIWHFIGNNVAMSQFATLFAIKCQIGFIWIKSQDLFSIKWQKTLCHNVLFLHFLTAFSNIFDQKRPLVSRITRQFPIGEAYYLFFFLLFFTALLFYVGKCVGKSFKILENRSET